MPNVLVHTADESVTLSAQAVRRPSLPVGEK